MPRNSKATILQRTKAEEAFSFYKKFIFNDEKLKLLSLYGFRTTGSVPFTDWELFACILVNEKSSGSYGADLTNFEVKSAKIGSSFEYQYHKFTGLKKLEDDIKVNHLFISYSENYDEVIVRVIFPQQISDIFKQWKAGLKLNYCKDSTKQRFRKSIPYGFVVKDGTKILHIKKDKLLPI
jgi:hypothetical protein